jgi:hypothetical protein
VTSRFTDAHQEGEARWAARERPAGCSGVRHDRTQEYQQPPQGGSTDCGTGAGWGEQGRGWRRALLAVGPGEGEVREHGLQRGQLCFVLRRVLGGRRLRGRQPADEHQAGAV